VPGGVAVDDRTELGGLRMPDSPEEHGGSARSDPGGEPAPGGPQAIAHGCVCSVLANAAYRAGQAREPCIDPLCQLHTVR